MSLEWWKIKPNNNKHNIINIDQFRNKNITEEYKEKTSKELNLNGHETPNEIWERIIVTTINTAKETLGYKKKSKKYKNEEIEEL